MINYWWIPVVVVWYGAYGVCSVKNNEVGSKLWFWLTFFVGLCPLWAWVSKHSKNIVIDAVLYDVFIVLGSFMAMYFMGAGKGLTPLNWFGAFCVISGLILLKLGQ